MKKGDILWFKTYKYASDYNNTFGIFTGWEQDCELEIEDLLPEGKYSWKKFSVGWHSKASKVIWRIVKDNWSTPIVLSNWYKLSGEYKRALKSKNPDVIKFVLDIFKNQLKLKK